MVDSITRDILVGIDLIPFVESSGTGLFPLGVEPWFADTCQITVYEVR